MQQISLNGLNLWQFDILINEPGLKHFVSERMAKESQKEFTLSYSSSPDKEEIANNRSLLSSALGIEKDKLFIPSQVHKSRIVHVNKDTKKEDLQETDALITQVKGLCIAVLAADCVPVLLYDKRNRIVGAVHSGWRGTVAKILEKTLIDMQVKYGTKGEDILACIGPSICHDSYEVGEEVAEAVKDAFGVNNQLLTPQANKKAKLDLWAANKLQLLDFGVKEKNIEISNLCTMKNNQFFFSARKGDSGRFSAGIMLVD